MLSGFGWVTNSFHNSDRPITFFIDDIYLNKPKLDDGRFLPSYEVKPTHGTLFDQQMVNVASAYGSALALLAYLARETEDDLRRARILADTFFYAVENEPTHTLTVHLSHVNKPTTGQQVENDPTQHVDSSPGLLIRNAYAAGDPALPPGWNPNGVPGEIRIAGYWDCENQAWFALDDALRSYSGDGAWSRRWLAMALVGSPCGSARR